VSKDGHVRRWPVKVECLGAIKPGSPVLLPKANQLAAVPSIDVLLCVPTIVAVMTRGRDGHEGAAKEERWFAYDLKACGWEEGSWGETRRRDETEGLPVSNAGDMTNCGHTKALHDAAVGIEGNGQRIQGTGNGGFRIGKDW